MSGYATPTTPTSGAGPQRSSRTSTMRQSESAATTSTDSGPRRMLLADMPEPSISDFNSSRAPSPFNFDPIPSRMRSPLGKSSESNNPSTSLTPEHQPTRAEPLSQGRNPARDPSTHIPMAPFVLTVTPEKEHSHERRPSIKEVFSSLSSKLDPRKLSRRRPSEVSVESDRTLVPAEQPVIDIRRPLSLTYDPDTQRFTGLEAWDTLFPDERRDPFAGLEVPVPPMEDTSPLSQTQQQQAWVHRVKQRLENLAWSTKARLPKTIQLLITPVTVRTPPNKDAPFISAPFNLVHRTGVTEDPQTGQLLGLPEEMQPPPAMRTRYPSQSSIVLPFRTSQRSSMPFTPRTRSQSGTSSSSEEPRIAQATAPPSNCASTTPPRRRRLTQSFSGRFNSARLPPAGLSSTSTNKGPPMGSRPSSQLPPPVPEKDLPREVRVGPPHSRHRQEAATVTRQATTYRTPRRSDFNQQIPVEEPHRAMAESSQLRQNPQTPPKRIPFGQARHTPRPPRPPYGYL